MRPLLAITSLLAVAALVGGPPPARAATYTAHDGATLATAVQEANAASGASTIDLTTGAFAPTTTLTIRGDVTIVGPSTPGGKIVGEAITPSGSDLFDVAVGAQATFVDVAMTNTGYGGQGAAVDDFGTVDLENSTLAGNDGPGMIVEPQASATLRNDTLADGLAAGLDDDGSATLINDTVADNAVEGIDDRVGALHLINTIVAENGNGDCSGPAQASDHSLDSDGSCGVGALTRLNPELGPLLAGNGGPTPTEALSAASPAIGAGDDSQCPAIDQRYFARGGGRCDIGAYQTDAQPAPGGPPIGSGSSGASTTGGSPGSSGSQPQSERRVVVGVSGHGSLPGARRSRITFALTALTTRPHGTLTYRDVDGRVWLKRATVASVVVNAARGIITFKGTSTNLVRRRRVSFVVTVVDHGTEHAVRLRLSSGYAGGGRVVNGMLTLATATGTPRPA